MMQSGKLLRALLWSLVFGLVVGTLFYFVLGVLFGVIKAAGSAALNVPIEGFGNAQLVFNWLITVLLNSFVIFFPVAAFVMRSSITFRIITTALAILFLPVVNFFFGLNLH